jgi:hypothetical protein
MRSSRLHLASAVVATLFARYAATCIETSARARAVRSRPSALSHTVTVDEVNRAPLGKITHQLFVCDLEVHGANALLPKFRRNGQKCRVSLVAPE